MIITVINNDNINLSLVGEVMDGIQKYNTVEQSKRENKQIRNVWRLGGVDICTLVRKNRSKVVIEIFTVNIAESLSEIFDTKQ